MQEFNRKGMRIVLLMAIAFMLLASISYARTIAEVFGNALAETGNFFELSQYEPYSNAIDFFLFSILFISLYMSGAKNVFKEFKRPEKIIVVLLGLITAFLLVLSGFSITLLLPYIHWILFLLLFLLLFWLFKGVEGKSWRFMLALALALLPLALLQGYCGINWLLYLIIFLVLLFLLKGIKNRLGRLVLALVITALIAFLLQFLCGYFGFPDISAVGEGAAAKGEGIAAGFGKYIGGLWENAKSISFNFAPGVPDWLRKGPTTGTVQDNRLQVVHPQQQAAAAPAGLQPAQATPTTTTGCGNGNKEVTEQCDDGQANNGDCPKKCSSDCRLNDCRNAWERNAPSWFGGEEDPRPAPTPAPTPGPAAPATQFQIIPPGSINLKEWRAGDIFIARNGNHRRVQQITRGNAPGTITILYYDGGRINNIKGDGQVKHDGIIRGATINDYVTIGNNRYIIRNEDDKYVLKRYNWFRDQTVGNPSTDEQLQNDLKAQGDRPISKNLDLKNVEVKNAGIVDEIVYYPGRSLLIAVIILIIGFRKKIFSRFSKKRVKDKEISAEMIDDIISRSTSSIDSMRRASENRYYLLRDATQRTAYLRALTKGLKDPAMLWTKDGRRKLKEEHREIEHILEEEFRFLDGLNELKATEMNLLNEVKGGLKRFR